MLKSLKNDDLISDQTEATQVTPKALMEMQRYILEDYQHIRHVYVVLDDGQVERFKDMICEASKCCTIVMSKKAFDEIGRTGIKYRGILEMMAGIPVTEIDVQTMNCLGRSADQATQSLQALTKALCKPQLKFEEERIFIPEEKPKYTVNGKLKRR